MSLLSAQMLLQFKHFSSMAASNDCALCESISTHIFLCESTGSRHSPQDHYPSHI